MDVVGVEAYSLCRFVNRAACSRTTFVCGWARRYITRVCIVQKGLNLAHANRAGGDPSGSHIV